MVTILTDSTELSISSMKPQIEMPCTERKALGSIYQLESAIFEMRTLRSSSAIIIFLWVYKLVLSCRIQKYDGRHIYLARKNTLLSMIN